jgi:hypothetical protein
MVFLLVARWARGFERDAGLLRLRAITRPSAVDVSRYVGKVEVTGVWATAPMRSREYPTNKA